MRKFISALFITFMTVAASAQTQKVKETPVTKISHQVVETACGSCMFHMKDKGCNLAVRINGKAYLVDGTTIDDHGDAHADDGFCNAVRKAEVSGSIVNDRFVATSFKLLPAEKKKP